MTTPDTPAKKVVAIEILHLDETGYGYEGKHTRRAWRAECLEHFEKGAAAFLAWQEKWQTLAEQNQLMANFNLRADFYDESKEKPGFFAKRGHCLDFAGHEFKNHVNARGYKFLYDACFEKATFTGSTDFSHVIFTGYADFEKASFSSYAYFCEAFFTGYADFSEATFIHGANFAKTTFTSYANFGKATFADNAYFNAVNFEQLADFLKTKFLNQIKFRDANFKGKTDFENAESMNVGHFEGATFNAPNSKIPSFRGVDVGSTFLEFSDDKHFTKTDFSEEAVKNIEFLKHLSEQHGQIDQALNFNAMELRAKYLQVVEPLREKSLPRFKRTFQRYFNPAWLALRLTWLYWKVSDFGRSYLRPSLWFVGLFFVTLVLAAGIATTHKPENCRYQQFGLISELKCDGAPLPKNPNAPDASKEDDKLYLDGYDAAFNYAMYHATGLVDFTGDSKLKEAINQRLFGKAIKPIWARLVGGLLSILNTALLFLIALGLRNSYRLK